jgi:hypothetical protein
MKERPILFSAPMVRALLDGSKTQTRRIIKKQPKGKLMQFVHLLRRGWHAWYDGEDQVNCPYGQPGDRLWVRETWRIGAWNEDEEQIAVDYMADGYARKEWLDVPLDERDLFSRLWKQSTDDAIKAGIKRDFFDEYHWEPGQSPCRIRPSIFMPRWASRITLEVVDVRVERLQDISEADAWAEGCLGYDDDVTGGQSGYGEYAQLWESINGKGSWDANPWVWVIEFKVST